MNIQKLESGQIYTISVATTVIIGTLEKRSKAVSRYVTHGFSIQNKFLSEMVTKPVPPTELKVLDNTMQVIF